MKPPARNQDATLLCRVSSEKQTEGYSLDFQERHGRDYASQNGLNIKKVSTLTESAFKDKRVKWEAYLERAMYGPETHILIPKVDRSLRNAPDLGVLIDFPKKFPHKVIHFFDDGIIYDKDSPSSTVLQLMMLGSMAIWYSHDLAQKSKRGLEEKARQGEWPNKAPYGYRNNKETKRIEVDPVMSPWIIRIKELIATAKYSCEAVAQLIWREGCPRRLSKSSVHYILRNPIYYGHVQYQDVYVKGVHEPIITKELHDAAIAALERFDRPKQTSRNFRFKGVIQCARCGCAVVFERKKQKYVYGHCTRRRPCDSKGNVREEEVELEVERILASLSVSPALSKRILGYLEESAPHAATANVSQLAIAEQTRGRIKAAQEKARDAMCRSVISEADYTKQCRAYEEQLIGLTEQIAKLEESAPANILPLARSTLELSNSCSQLYKTMNDDQKRELLDSVCSNFSLDGKKLAPQWRKPFQLVAEMALRSNWLRD
jgi:site-specific DNA recombinase